MSRTDEPHTHPWPKKIAGDKSYTCRGCGLEVPGFMILAAREDEEPTK